MTSRVKDAVAILKRSRKLKWAEADVRAFARELVRLGESGLLKTWFAPEDLVVDNEAPKQLDKRLSALSRRVSTEKGRLLGLFADFLREKNVVSEKFFAGATNSGPRFFGALCSEVGEARAVASYETFEKHLLQKSNRKYKF